MYVMSYIVSCCVFVVHLTQARKKTKAEKGAMIEKIRSAVEQYPYIYIIAVENMRNLYLKKFREDFKDSKQVQAFVIRRGG